MVAACQVCGTDLILFTVDQELPTDSIDNLSQPPADENYATEDDDLLSPTPSCSTAGESSTMDLETENIEQSVNILSIIIFLFFCNTFKI